MNNVRTNYIELNIEELEQLVAVKDGQAMCELGRRYRFGEQGVEMNYTASYRMYHKAEKMNMKEAFIALGQMYENGEYFAKNLQIAQEYYAKAGDTFETVNKKSSVQPINITTKKQETERLVVQELQHVDGSTILNETVAYQTKEKTVASDALLEKYDIVQILKKADAIRQQGDIIGAKLYVQQAVDQLNSDRDKISAVDIVELEAHINWMYAYIAFNEQKFADFEKYVFKNNVVEYFPWSTYLTTVVHRMLNANGSILSQDAQNMLNVLNSPRLETTQLGDIFGLLGDLCLMGISTAGVNSIEQAFGFYENAANAGNQYAGEQLKRFTKNMFGKLVYKEK